AGRGSQEGLGPGIRLDSGNRLRVRENDILMLPEGGDDHNPPLFITYPVDQAMPLLPPEEDGRPSVMVVMPFLAVGGAERVALEVMYQLKDEIRFILATVERHALSLGSMAGLFRQITPYVFTVFDWLSPQLRFSFLEYLIDRFSPRTLYIANGSNWIYDMLGPIKHQYPDLWIVNQVYDHRVGWINRYDAHLALYIDAHIGCNEKICRAYQQRGVPAERVYLIEHGIDTAQFDPSRYSETARRSIYEQMGVPPGKRVVTFMGRLHPQKRPMDFVELARRFAYRPDLIFLMVGGGPMAGAIDAEVQRMGLRNLIRRPFLQATDVLAISDVVVLPSEYEGMPMVVLEAQAMGKPVVVTDVGNTREILETTGGGVLVQTIGDIGALTAGVEEMLASPPDPERVRQAVVAHFDIRRIAASYKRVLLGR
ncbi:MAG: glycosyltransferase family 4 protein, partial [Armatimonadota bacterium]